MDPITAAIITALANLSKDAIKDCYCGLKGLLKSKFGATSDLMDAVDKLEKKPDSKGRQTIVQEEVEAANINNDPEIMRLVEDLRNIIEEKAGGEGGINQTQTNTISGVNVGGNFEFQPVQQG